MKKIILFAAFILLAGGATAATFKLKHGIVKAKVTGTASSDAACTAPKAPCIGNPCGTNAECFNELDEYSKYTGHYGCRCIPGYYSDTGKNCI